MNRRYHLPGGAAGEGPPDERERLASAVREAVRRAVEAAAPGEVVPPRPRERARERFDGGRRASADTYTVPGYDDRGRAVAVPLADPGASARTGAPAAPAAPPEPAEPSAPGAASGTVSGTAPAAGQGVHLDTDRAGVPARGPGLAAISGLIRSRWPLAGWTDPAGVRYGAYLTAAGAGTPRLYYLAPSSEGPTLRALRIARRAPDGPHPVDLPSGEYTVIARPHSPGQLYRGTRRLDDLGNPQDLDLTVNFTVPDTDVAEVTVHAARRHHLWPRLRIQRTDQGSATVGADTVYLAEVEIWRVDEADRWTPVFQLALVYAFVRFHWQVYRIEHDRHGERQRVPVDHPQPSRSTFTHRFDRAGEYEVECEVRLSYEDASPQPVTERRTDRVQRLEEKMALELATLERAARAPGAEPVWSTSAQALLDAARARLRQAERAPVPNEALVRELRDAVAGLEKRLDGPTSAGPFPVRALFTDRRTAQSRPISLFVGPAAVPEGPGHTWLLIDLTYPAFYRTYRGTGPSPEAALRAAFENARTSFRGNYPPGRILARIEWPGMDRLHLKPFDFATDTESWQRTAWEWLSAIAAGLAVVGVAAALAFPPTSAVVGAIVLAGAVAGGVLSAVNLAERVHQDAFEWDRETAVDLVSLATAFASLGGAVARGVAAGMTRSIASGAPLTIETAGRLNGLLRFQHAVLYVDLGAHLSDSLLLSYDTYVQLRDIDAAMGAGALAQLQRQFGPEEGRRRFETERFTRILGVLARAAVSGLLTVVSMRGTAKAIAAGAARNAAGRLPGLDRRPAVRLAVAPGPALPAFPDAEFALDRAGFRRRQVDGVAARLGLVGDPAGLAETASLSPQAAWRINAAFDGLSEEQRALVLATLRPGGADLRALRTFLGDGGSMAELARFLETQPVRLRGHITTFNTLQSRAADFRRLGAAVPELAAFRWDPQNLHEHFYRHVLGRANHPDEAWKWAQRLGIAETYGLDRARYLAMLGSTAPADAALRAEITTKFRSVYGDYVHAVLVRSAVFGRSGRGAELIGSDGELLWAASPDGLISTGYFPDNPARWPAPVSTLQGKLEAALAEGQSVVLLFRGAP
ncbi:hypothetical protein ABZU94_37065 [Streptomyces mirabilis]|uniref:hypothetical protein n=1 Tax=Streptomyces sp. NPDC005388 TaxID=3156717 RepID=UPI0033AD715D